MAQSCWQPSTGTGVILAGGLHPACRAEYFRIGHMGACTLGDLLATVGAVEQGLVECGYSVKESGVEAVLNEYRAVAQAL